MAAHVQPRLFFFFLVLLPLANSISFNYSTFNGHERINFKSNASQAEEVINLTRNQIKNHTAVSSNIGWATYKDPVPIYDKATRKLADFTTHFSFIIQGYNATDFGDGLAFFLAPFGSDFRHP
ncbi:hypothetical protein QJS04_geneDACA006484 [Acorus gramineus]|uniref:Legume lectin domain-containing protein n=1 Tax=Acorus gramineus TaxID=55184 RepID=A0AAV9AXU3_ACOGR|nr:hypothetical protein QJS04_geneDACA006484 [Acorus gramineus]